MSEFSEECEFCNEEFRRGNRNEHLANEHPEELDRENEAEERRAESNREFRAFQAEQKRREREGLPLF